MAKTANRKRNDRIYNARRRYRRQAERYADQAETVQGAERNRLLSLAQAALSNALSTYSQKTKQAQGALKRLADRLGGMADLPETRGVTDVDALERESMSALDKATKKRGRGLTDAQATALLNTGNIGSRFFAATREAWVREDEAYTPQDQIIPRILEYFGVSSVAEVMDMMDDAGVDLYSSPENDSKYMDAVAMGMLYVQSYKQNR